MILLSKEKFFWRDRTAVNQNIDLFNFMYAINKTYCITENGLDF